MVRAYCFLTFSAVAALCSPSMAAYIGNPITNVGNGDAEPPLVILGEFGSNTPAPSSAISFASQGTINDVQLYSDKAGLTFTVYTLRPAGLDANNNQQFNFLTASSFTTTGSGPELFAMSVPVQAGDLLGFSGQGPVYGLNGSDATYEDLGADQTFTATAPLAGNTYSFGTNANLTSNYIYIPKIRTGGVEQDNRTYAFGVDVTYVPEPSALSLLGVASLALYRRRRRVAS